MNRYFDIKEVVERLKNTKKDIFLTVPEDHYQN
jgi:hypothetical protein